MNFLRKKTGVQVLWGLLFLIISIALIVPFSPKMPAYGLDPAWALAINEAVAQSFSFGKEIIFTLGPYAAIYTKVYHPATDGMMLWGGLCLSLVYGVTLLLLLKRLYWPWILALLILYLFFIYSKDALFLSLPLLLGIYLFDGIQNKTKRSIKTLALLAGLFSVLGLLPLIKGSFLLFVGAMLVWMIVFLLSHRLYWEALIVLVSPLCSLSLFWVAAGQSLVNVMAYLQSSVDMAFSFTQAMSLNGDGREPLAYTAASLLILSTFFTKKPKGGMYYIAGLFFLFLLISFKAAFTRHFGHSLIAATALAMAALFLPLVVQGCQNFLVISGVLVVSFFIVIQHTAVNPLKNIQSTYITGWHGLLQRITMPRHLKEDYELSMQFLWGRNQLPAVAGSSDIYSYEQTDLIASKNRWVPRPVFQSYSVFNAHFSQINQQHLMSAKGPDTIFFKIQAIDNRLPALEDGLSWLYLLNQYRSAFWHKDFLVLKKEASSRFKEQVYAQQTISLDELFLLPDITGIVAIEIKLQPTIWGRIKQFFYKPQQLLITMTMQTEEQKAFRFVASMGQARFIVSPLIENTQDFSRLYDDVQLFPDNKVKAVHLGTASKAVFFSDWQKQYQMRLITYKIGS